MEIIRNDEIAWELSDPARFSGKGRIKRLPGRDGDPAIRAYRVEFEPTVRTNWHTHSGVQILLIVEGKCRVQKQGEAIQEVGVGDMVYIAPGEKHWHGASPDTRMTHIALNLNAETTWLEPVSDEQYASLSA